MYESFYRKAELKTLQYTNPQAKLNQRKIMKVKKM